MERFALSEVQAQAILDMRLQRLTNLEIVALRKEYADILKLIDRLEGILKSEKKLLAVIRKEMEAIADAYPDDVRRTTLEAPDDTPVELPDNTPIPEDAVVVFTRGGYLKRLSPAQLKRTPLPAPEESLPDSARFELATTTTETLYIFTNLGNCYPVGVGKLTECRPRDRGQLLSGVLAGLEEGEEALMMLTAAPAKLKDMPDLLFLTRGGMIKRTQAGDYDVRSRKYPALSLKKDDSLLDIRLSEGEQDLLLISRSGMSIRFPLSAVPVQGRTASGVKAMALDAGDEVIWARQVRDDEELILFSERGWAKRIPILDFETQNRGGKGIHCFRFNRNGSNGSFVAGLDLSPRDQKGLLLIQQVRSPESRLSRDEILLQNRSGKGMPYVMAILDDIVTGIIPLPLQPDPEPQPANNPDN